MTKFPRPRAHHQLTCTESTSWSSSTRSKAKLDEDIEETTTAANLQCRHTHIFRRHWDKQSIEQGSHSPIDLKLPLSQTFPEKTQSTDRPSMVSSKDKSRHCPFYLPLPFRQQPSHRQGPRAGIDTTIVKTREHEENKRRKKTIAGQRNIMMVLRPGMAGSLKPHVKR